MEKKLEEKKNINPEIKADFEAEGEMFDDSEIEENQGAFLYLLAQISYEQYNQNKTG